MCEMRGPPTDLVRNDGTRKEQRAAAGRTTESKNSLPRGNKKGRGTVLTKGKSKVV